MTNYFRVQCEINSRSIFAVHQIQDLILMLDLEQEIRKLVYKSLYKTGAFHNDKQQLFDPMVEYILTKDQFD